MSEKDVGPFIATLRADANITQKQVSEDLNVSIQTISKFENGKSSPSVFSSRLITRYILEECGIGVSEALVMFYQYKFPDDKLIIPSVVVQ